MFTSKWHMHRMGLVDFWYYDNEEFYFSDGHMLLRGSNGSGKSVTMQSFIPLLLDGNKSSERLDSFGTRSRKIENYLLEEDGERDNRIGYLYLEFKRQDSEIYTTIGMGLHARKNKPLNTWYFVIEDNRRINKDFSLIDKQGLAITKQMLKNIIGTQLIDTQSEYMDRVNQILFGFSTRDEYKEVINLLMQLRSPKLSNSLKPTMINEILSDSLQPLSEEDLRPMSEAISNMDEIKDQLDALKLSYNAAKDISKIYELYNHMSLDQKATNYLNEKQQLNKKSQAIKQFEKYIEQKNIQKQENKQQLEKLIEEQQILEEEKNALLQTDMLALVEDVTRQKENLKDLKHSKEVKENYFEEKDNQRIQVQNQLKKITDKQDMQELDIRRNLKEMETLQDTIHFDEYLTMKQEILEHLEKVYESKVTYIQIEKILKDIEIGLNYFYQFDYCKKQEDRYLEEKEEQLSIKEQLEIDLNQYQNMFIELQDEIKENFYQWNEHNQYLKLNDQLMQEIIQQVLLFETKQESFVKIDEIINQEYLKYYQDIMQDEASIKQQRMVEEKTLRSLQFELEKWQKQKNIQPELDEYMQNARQFLETNHIPYRAMYQLLDFDTTISEEKRNHFEELLSRSGILYALLVNKEDQDKVLQTHQGMAEYYLFTDLPIDQCTTYMINETLLSQTNLEDLIQHFHIQNLKMTLHENYYELSGLVGTISKQVQSKYIGETSREKYRLLMIEELTQQINTLSQQIYHLDEQLKQNQEMMKQLEQEKNNVPKLIDLQVVKNQMVDKQRHIETINQQIQKVQHELTKIASEMMNFKRSYSELASKLNVYPSKEAFIQLQEAYKQYRYLLDELIMLQKEYCTNNELKLSFEIQLDNYQEDVDMLKIELDQMNSQISKTIKVLEQKEKQLEKMGYEDVKNRIETIQQTLLTLPAKISKYDRLDSQLDTELIQDRQQLDDMLEDINNQKQNEQNALNNYEEEARLFYVCDNEEQIKNVNQIHNMIQEKYPNAKRKDLLANDLQTVFYAQRGMLQEYNLSIYTIFDHDDCMRLDISARYQGVKIPFKTLIQNLEMNIEKQSLLLEESDRELIEDILVNTISKKIRAHIQKSKRWVETMNRYMNEMNTSSGLKLNLQWKSKKADNENELSSEKLVELLEKDVRLLKDNDLKALSSHFRSKILMARKLTENEEVHESFHQIMKQVMDYRKWYDFRILSQKTGEKKKELTNNTFYAFSGGEKAMSMYVPLFSAVAAKFESAREEAPWLIALDEAFAGVDEKNINNMFNLIRKFKFDFIMNSQVLWGDYPSVKSLAIYELFRPENAHYVTVISYKWDGKVKQLVSA